MDKNKTFEKENFEECSVGRFEDDGKAFVVTDNVTEFPMTNVMYNKDGFVCETGQNGMASATLQFKNNETAALTDKNNSTIYFKDDDTGEVWCAAGFPYLNDVQSFECKHARGCTEISSEKNAVEIKIRIFVPNEFSGIVYRVYIRNAGDSVKRISAVPAARLALTGFSAPRFCDGQNQTSYGDFESEINGYFYNNLNPWSKLKNDKYSAAMMTNAKVDSYEGEETSFFKSNDSISAPYEILHSNHLRSKLSLGGKPFAALMIKYKLKPEEEVCFDYSLAIVKDLKEAKEIYRYIDTSEKAERLFICTQNSIDNRFDRVVINTPEKKLDYFVNTWLKKGLEYCLKKKDATRDNLQFANGLIMTEPDTVKKEIIKVLGYQYSDGHTVRSWFPLDTEYYSDGPLWIVMTVCNYLKYTDDIGLLDITVPYFDGGGGTVYDHLKKCIERIDKDRGPHGLPLARYADWNDALNLNDEQAESVFMAMAFGYMLSEMEQLERYLKHDAAADDYIEKHKKLKELVNETAWDKDGNYYIRGFSNGKPIGSSMSDGSKIYVNPQSWSIIGKIVTNERLSAIANATENMIETELGCVVNFPAYSKYSKEIGRISAQLPGTVENGAVYCHATAFKVYADTLIGNGDAALRDLLKILPDSDQNPAKYSGALPYAMTSSYDINENTKGRAGRPWLTGSQTWAMNTVVNGLLGIRLAYGGFVFEPSLPHKWDCAECRIERKDAVYNVRIKRTGTKQIYVDSKPKSTLFVPFFDSGLHNIDINI